MAISRTRLPPSPLCSRTHDSETTVEEVHPNTSTRSDANLVAKAGNDGAVLVWGAGEPQSSPALVAAAKALALVDTEHPRGIAAMCS